MTSWPFSAKGTLFAEFSIAPDNFSTYRGITIYRVPHVLRGHGKLQLLVNYVSFFVSATLLGCWKLRKVPCDVIFVFAVSPITVAIPAIFLGYMKRASVFLWVLDLWPETLAAVGVVKSRLLLKLVGVMVRWIYAKSDHILIQSRAFASSIRKYCAHADQIGKVIYFPNWAEQVFSDMPSTSQNVVVRDENLFTVLFAGNLGDAQDFPSILAAAERLKAHSNIRLIIVGDGRMSDYLSQEVVRRDLSSVVTLLGRFPVDVMPSFFAVADALLVTLKSNDIFSRTIPGKLQSYLAAAKPILGMLDGEARAVIDESGAGLSCASGNSERLAELVLQMAALEKADLLNMGAKGRYYYERHFDRGTLMNKLESWFCAAVEARVPSDDTVH